MIRWVGIFFLAVFDAMAASPVRVDCASDQAMRARALICEYALLGRSNNKLADLDEQIIASRRTGNANRWISQRDACADVNCIDKVLDKSRAEAAAILAEPVSVPVEGTPEPADSPHTMVQPVVQEQPPVTVLSPEPATAVPPAPTAPTPKSSVPNEPHTTRDTDSVFVGFAVLIGFAAIVASLLYYILRRILHRTPLAHPRPSGQESANEADVSASAWGALLAILLIGGAIALAIVAPVIAAIVTIVLLLIAGYGYGARCPSCSKWFAEQETDRVTQDRWTEYEDRQRVDVRRGRDGQVVDRTYHTDQVAVSVRRDLVDYRCKYCQYEWQDVQKIRK